MVQVMVRSWSGRVRHEAAFVLGLPLVAIATKSARIQTLPGFPWSLCKRALLQLI
jgi:hypothetical protein